MSQYFFFKKYNSTIIQLVLLYIVATIFTFLNGVISFKSAWLGGSAWIIPNLYFTRKFHQIKTTFDFKKMLKLFLLSEMVKLFLSFGIIIIILLTCTVDKIGFLGGYIVMILASLLAAPFGYSKG